MTHAKETGRAESKSKQEHRHGARGSRGAHAVEPAHDRRLVSLSWLSERWSCSPKTCRRILERAGVLPLYLGGDARNATLRFDLEDVLRVEEASQAQRIN